MMTILKTGTKIGVVKIFVLLFICFSVVLLQTPWSGAENRFTKFRQAGDPLDDKIERGQSLKKSSHSPSAKGNKVPTSEPRNNRNERQDRNKTISPMNNVIYIPYNAILPENVILPSNVVRLPPGKSVPVDKKNKDLSRKNGPGSLKDKKSTKDSAKDSKSPSKKIKRERIMDRIKEGKSKYTTSGRFDTYRDKSQLNSLSSGY